jgi:hypothetical protein
MKLNLLNNINLRWFLASENFKIIDRRCVFETRKGAGSLVNQQKCDRLFGL